jgi:hypothetical protein
MQMPTYLPTLTMLVRIQVSSPQWGLRRWPLIGNGCPPSLHCVQVVSVIDRLPSNLKWSQPKLLPPSSFFTSRCCSLMSMRWVGICVRWGKLMCRFGMALVSISSGTWVQIIIHMCSTTFTMDGSGLIVLFLLV